MVIEKGNSSAMCHYAFMLENGKGIPVDYVKAIK